MNIAARTAGACLPIGVFIRGRDMGSVVKDMQARVAKRRAARRRATTIAWSGEFENQQRAMTRLSLIVPLSIVLIFVLLFDAFNSVRSALLILANVPFALIGGIFALLDHRHPADRVGGDRLHRAVRPGGAERRRDGQLLQPAARGRAHAVRGGDAGRARCGCARC